MNYLKKIFNKLNDIFCMPQAPIGLNAMGIRGNYLNRLYTSNYSLNRFCTKIVSPVNDPYLINLSDL